MLKFMIPTLLLVPTIWLLPPKWLWVSPTMYGFAVSLGALIMFKNLDLDTGWLMFNPYMGLDAISTPLFILTCWLFPLTILASQYHLSTEPINRQRAFLTLLTSLQVCMMLAFVAVEIMLFFIAFEAALIPTLLIMTRWGSQEERLYAGQRLLFYTMVGSAPLIVCILTLQNNTGTLSLVTLPYADLLNVSHQTSKLWWTGCTLAFLVKLPLYGVHLWLPKAHVEAPIAGSMVLSGILLKLGGYGLMRFMLVLESHSEDLNHAFMIIALWGVVVTSALCLRQTDVKSLIAYSSVSHMGLVTCGILVQTHWGFYGAMVLMVSHALTSSALFCLANANYERTHTRSILFMRSIQMLLPLLAKWWFIACLTNLAFPPFPNLVGELLILVSLCKWTWASLIIIITSMILVASFSLYIHLMTKQTAPIYGLSPPPPAQTREHLLMLLHLGPLFLLSLKPELLWGLYA
uniref:NADH-ubiquinone oxidoreductase chain 4 n=1 Tax=Lepidoblepharon ophthalmolepis TaxID=195621 RepID=A0A090AKI7_9PLEU|nr:NADH dehydrogenase subunit 4 [Lepidoblepharon ophthalmolepis]BAP58973.1 NADH dehydrogenase subunit 4 [Lepidoblepharon ophthalmolepis]